MSRRSILAVTSASMVVAILLIVGALVLHRVGWSEGYQVGLLVFRMLGDETLLSACDESFTPLATPVFDGLATGTDAT
jgi:hypothetical protein